MYIILSEGICLHLVICILAPIISSKTVSTKGEIRYTKTSYFTPTHLLQNIKTKSSVSLFQIHFDYTVSNFP